MENKKIPLKICCFVAKSGKAYPVLKFGDKIVTFDQVILSCMSGLSIRALAEIEEDIIIGEF